MCIRDREYLTDYNPAFLTEATRSTYGAAFGGKAGYLAPVEGDTYALDVYKRQALVLVLGGGIGNLIDRVLNGEVVDYINLLFMRFAVVHHRCV